MFIIILDIHSWNILINKVEKVKRRKDSYQQIHRHNNIITIRIKYIYLYYY